MRTAGFGGAGEVSRVGFGTWNLEQEDRSSVRAALRRSLDLGATHVDTAEMYGSGRVESLLGEELVGLRDRVFLVSKVLPSNATRAGTVRACEASLRRLRTDVLDGYLLHWPGAVPLEETVAGFEDLRAAGKIRSYGVSNFDIDELEQVVALAGPGRVVCNQVLYHPEERAIEHAVLPACRRHGVALVAYSPFGSTASPWSEAGRAAVASIGRSRGLAPHAVALAFLLRHPDVFVIPKTCRPDRVEVNTTGDLDLTPTELELLERAFPLGPRPSSLPTL